MALFDPTLNLITKYSTCIKDLITCQILLNIYQALKKIVNSNFSSTEILFKESTTRYEDNLWQSGYNKKLTYKPTDTNQQKHSKHKRQQKHFYRNWKIFFKPVRPTFPKEPHLQ